MTTQRSIDIEIMKNTDPFIDEMSIAMLSILSPRQAIFTGTAFNRPNIVQIKFDDSKTKFECDIIKLINKWRRRENFDEDAIVDEPIYCEYCYNKMFRG